MASKRFVRLEREVEAEYRRKGYSLRTARYIGRAVAGEVAARKHDAAKRRRNRRTVKRRTVRRRITRRRTRRG